MAGAGGDSEESNDAEDQIRELINVDAISQSGPPREPTPDSRAVVLLQRFNSQMFTFCLVAWFVIVLITIAVRVPPTDGHGSRLVIGGFAAAVGGVATLLAIRSKQRDHAAGREPNRTLAMGVSWSTRFLLAGGGFMVIGMGLIFSVK